MADAAQLKLQVGLDLAFFRQQLALLGTTAAGYSLPINIDRLGIQKEITKLGKNISSRNYKLNISTNIEAEIKNADRLVKALNRVQKASGRGRSGLPVDIRQLQKTQSQGGFTAKEIKTLFNAAIEGGLLDEKTLGKTRGQMVAAFADIGRDSIEGLLNGLSSADASIRAAAGSIGSTLIATTKASLGIRSPSKEFEEIGKNVGRGFEKGVLASMDAAFNALERKMQQRTRVLDTMARGIFHMLGMDPASMMAAQRQKLLPPAINWQSSVATPPQYQGKPGTMLAGAPAPTLIGGTAFGAQKYLPTALGNETKKVLRDAAHVFLDTIKQGIREVKIRDLGKTINSQAMLSGRNIAGLLPPGVGRAPNAYTTGAIGGETQAERFARREREARARSSFREMDVMGGGGGRTAASYNYAYRAARPTSAIIPYGPGGALVAGGGGGGNVPPRPPMPPSGGGNRGDIGNPIRNLSNIKLPGAGLVSELGGEFAMAAKQVLLFGTAYKALAFLTDFPGKVGNAVGQLQTFRNTLKSITPSGEEFRTSNKFILDTVDKYNVPLQSARQGFTSLYASMAPAGFKGDEIRNIFTGISKGAATFGMSADKVDRVTYAFAQMASKGQVMAEEVKGQLGDVMPGAVAIFAEAAGFKGPEAMTKFTKAMEDGTYKGAAMQQLLKNVGVVMNEEFGPGAEGAARTFQGLMNRMQNATLQLYEAFEPMAIGFANKVVLPMTEGLKVAADGFNVFFTGQQAVTKGGAELAAKLQELKPTFEGLAANAKAVADRVIDLSKAFVPLLELGAKLLATPLAGFLAQTYVSVLLLNSAFTALGGRFAVTSMVAYFSRLNTALVLTQAQMIATGGAANAMSLRILAAGSTSVGAASATTQLTLALRAMWVAMTGPVGLAVAGLAAVTAAAYLMNKPFKEYIDSMPARFANFWRDLQSQATVSISNVIAMWQYLATVTSETFRSMTSGASALYDGLVGALGPIAPWFGNMMQWLKNAWIETIAFMVNQSSPVLGIAKMLGVDVGKTLMVNLTKDRNLPAPGQFTPAGGVSFDAQGNPIGAPLSPFIPGGGALPPIPGATVDGVKGSKEADKALKVENQTQEKLRSLQREIELATQLTTLKELQFQAEMSGDEELQIRLQGEERGLGILHATASALDGITDSRVRQKELAKAEASILTSRLNVVFGLARFEEKRKTSFEDVIADLNLELALKRATTEQAREQLRIDAERSKLVKQKLFTPEQINAIIQKKGELARPQTDGEKVQTRISTLQEEITKLTNIGNIAIKVADGIGAAFGQAFEGLITGSMSAQEALGNFFKSIGNMFIQMAAEIIAKQMTMIVLGFLMKALGLTAGIGNAGNAAGAAAFSPGNAAGLNAIPGQAFSMPQLAANGAIFSGGIAKFATGGIVNGPTLFPFADGGAMQMGLMGEAGPEAIMPLQRGADGSLGVRAAMGGNGMGGSSSPVLNMNFETSTINGVEYVSRDQLELAMAQTRRQASRDGANKGMAMTLDKIQQSPQTRRRIGM